MQLTSIYSVPIWQTDYDNYEEIEKILREIEEVRNKYESVSIDNIGGYQSPNVLQTIPKFNILFQFLSECIQKSAIDIGFNDFRLAITSSWVNVIDNHSMVREHFNGEVFTGILCLKRPEEGSADILIKNHCINHMWNGLKIPHSKNEFLAKQISIEPEVGSVIILPSYLSYSIEPSSSDDESVFISFESILLNENEFNERILLRKNIENAQDNYNE